MKCSVPGWGTAAAAWELSPLHLLREPAHHCPDHLICREREGEGGEREQERGREGERERSKGGREKGSTMYITDMSDTTTCTY